MVEHGEAELIEAVTAHVEEHLGRAGFVAYDGVAVLPSPASAGRPFHVVVTCGSGGGTELFVLLPERWPLEEAALREDATSWPLRMLATLVHATDGARPGLAVPNGEPPRPWADGTALCGALVMPPMLVPAGFAVLARPGGDEIRFLMATPVTADELRLVHDAGADALYDHFDDANLDPVIDPGRATTVRDRPNPFDLL